MKKKRIKLLIITVFIMVAGVFYTKSIKSNQQEKMILLNDKGSITEAITDEQEAVKDSSQNEEQTFEESSKLYNQGDTSTETQDKQKIVEELQQTTTDSTIFIHLCGAVKNPGVYEVPARSRLMDVVSLAGGLTSDAAQEYTNLAQVVEDGSQFYIPLQTEVIDIDRTQYQSQHNARVGESIKNNRLDGKEEAVSGDHYDSSTNSRQINLNTAKKEELTMIPGIGDAKAQAIIEYRELRGSFTKVEDVMNIRGIKDGLFQKIKDYITVG